jgi:hypothetical protein
MRVAAVAALAGGVAALAPQPASAKVRVGIGLNIPLYGGYAPRYYRHPPLYYRPAPPPVYYMPPPVYYAPPPAYYAPPPAYYPPPAYNPPPFYGESYLPSGAVPASPDYRNGRGEVCREYRSTIVVDGRPQASYGTACLQQNGTWQLVN